MWLPENYRDGSKYPRLNYLNDFIRDLILIAIIDVSIRLFHYFIKMLSEYLPVSNPQPELEPYLPLSVTRTLVTIFDGVAIVILIIISFFTVIKIWHTSLKRVSK